MDGDERTGSRTKRAGPAAAARPAAGDQPAAGDPPDAAVVRVGPERIALAPLLIFFLGTIPLGLSSRAFYWLLLLPLVGAVWVLRARVVAGPGGLVVCNGARRRRYRWEQVAGFDLPRRRFVRLLLTGGGSMPLTPLPRRRLREVLAVAPVRPAADPG